MWQGESLTLGQQRRTLYSGGAVLVITTCTPSAVMEIFDTRQSARPIHPCVIELRVMLQTVLGENFVRLHHFGSRVVGGAGSDSDYDVLCVTRRPLSRQEMDDVMDRRIDLQLAHDVFFDLHFFINDEIELPPIECLLFLQHAVAEGIVV
jgi:hypothetical protein